MKALEAIAAAIIREASGHADDVLLKAADAVIDGACAKMGRTRAQLAPVL